MRQVIYTAIQHTFKLITRVFMKNCRISAILVSLSISTAFLTGCATAQPEATQAAIPTNAATINFEKSAFTLTEGVNEVYIYKKPLTCEDMTPSSNNLFKQQVVTPEGGKLFTFGIFRSLLNRPQCHVIATFKPQAQRIYSVRLVEDAVINDMTRCSISIKDITYPQQPTTVKYITRLNTFQQKNVFLTLPSIDGFYPDKCPPLK